MRQKLHNLEGIYVLDIIHQSAPERENELNELMNRYNPQFFQASDKRGFILEELSFGFIQFTNRTLLHIWLMGWVLWKEMYCWSTFIWEFAMMGKPFLLSELEAMPGQKQSYDDADKLYSEATTFIESEKIDWNLWPSSIPEPKDFFQDGYTNLSNSDLLINDLVYHTLAFIFLHEIRHFILHTDDDTVIDSFKEEFECDKWATEYLLSKSDGYARITSQNLSLVKSKRAMGISLGKAIIAHIQGLGLWEYGEEHPSIADRMIRLVDKVNLPGNDHVWNVSICFLLASLRRQDALPNRINFKEQRDLFIKLLERESRVGETK